MEQMALYREWRPQTFGEVIGQEHVCRTLRNAVLMERAAHAYLFCGPRGTGKTSTARILAKALNCLSLKDGEPCGVCLSCRSITDGISLNVIEMDAASHRGIEEIRDLRQKVGMAPSGGRYKVYIIDEVHMLTGEAFNALLKTLEEPPAHAVFILATTEAHKVPLTILSRCQRFDFRRLSRLLIKNQLARIAGEKGWSVEDEALELISRQAGGALRDALGLLDQAASFAGGKIRRKDIELLTGALGDEELKGIITAAAQGDVPGSLGRLDVIFERGSDPRQVLLQLADYGRELLFRQGVGKKEQVFYARLLREIALAEGEMKGSPRPDLLLELALLRLTGVPSPGSPAEKMAGRAAREQAAPAHSSAARSASQKAPQREEAPRQEAAEPHKAGEVKATPAADNNPDLYALHNFLIKSAGKQPLLSRVLPRCKLKRAGNTLLLMAPSLYCDLIKKDDNLKTIKESLRECGCSLQLDVAAEDDERRQPGAPDHSDPGGGKESTAEQEARPPRHAAAKKAAGNPDELVNIALRLFDGKIIRRIEEDE
jgi:DNA polymerase-3 subunit gamma/tau